MLYLYRGGGSSDIIMLGDALSVEKWECLRQHVCRLLNSRRLYDSAEWLEKLPFELLNATNGFGDEFSILFARLPFETYVGLSEKRDEPETKWAFQYIAKTISEVGPYIRFIVAELDTEDSNVVSSSTLQFSSKVVKRALADAEHLIHTQGPLSGIDRVHTALHGYLRIIAQKASIDVSSDASITQVFKAVRENHPAFVENIANGKEVRRIIHSMASIIDAINVIRNRASLAHPNENLLEEPEAMLVVNTVKTLLHYVDSRLKNHSPYDM